MQLLNQQELDGIKREVASRLKTGNVPYLLAYIEDEFEYLLKVMPEDVSISYKRRFSEMEQVTENQKQKVTEIVFSVTFMHGMLATSLMNEKNKV